MRHEDTIKQGRFNRLPCFMFYFCPVIFASDCAAAVA